MGLRKTLERKVKTWAVFELAQNSWDENGTTEVAITLSKPKNGKSVLTCIDNAPKGYDDLSHAHTMFSESYKKGDPTKRGRFNIGEKNVLAVCDEAKITSTTGQVVFHKNGKRTANSTKRKAGSEFYGIVDMTDEEWDMINKQVSGLFPPIKTFYNGVEISTRKPFRTFEATVPTEIADENGVLRARKRKTEIRIYPVKSGEVSSIYEEGIPVVTIDSKWHVDIQQKIPLNTERDNVTPGYLKIVRATVLNEMLEFIEEKDAAEPWVSSAMSSKLITKEAATKVMDQRFTKDRVSYDPSDKGSNKEAVSKDHVVVHGGSMSKGEWAQAKRHGVITPAGQKFPTNFEDREPKERILPKDYTSDQKRYAKMIEVVSPIIINHTAEVQIFADDTMKLRGCTRWGKTATETESGDFIFEINQTFHDCRDWDSNYYLLLHELAHHMVKSNDHLSHVFYETVIKLGTKLVELALNQAELFTNAHVEKIVALEVRLGVEEEEAMEVGA